MPGESKYLLDANVFIQAKRSYYALDLCPGFWKCLLWHQRKGRIQSIDRIKQELEKGKDDLAKWVTSKMPEECFASTDDPSVIREFGRIQTWVENQTQFRQEAKAEFAQVADGWLTAYAKAKDLILVTHEVYNPHTKKKVPMPNVCKAFTIDYVDTFEMLRKLSVEFAWTPAR